MGNQKEPSTLNLAAIFGLFLISMCITVVTPAMATFIAQWPEHGPTGDGMYAYISTLPTLFTLICSPIFGALAGKKMKFKTISILGTALITVGGCLPAVVGGSFYFVLFTRALVGAGAGMLSPLGNALILGCYKGQKQATYLGWGTLFMNGGGIVFQLLGGFLAENGGWQMTFWGHAFGLVSLILAFFIPEPPKAEAPSQAGPAKKEKMHWMVWFVGFFLLVFNILNYPVMMNISVLFEQRNAGGAAAASIGTTLYTVAGMVAGMIFGALFSKLKRFVIPVGMAFCTLGAFLVYSGQTAMVMDAGLMCVGFGFSCWFPAMTGLVGMWTPPSTVAFGMSIVMALMNGGGFLCSYWLMIVGKITGDAVVMPILLEVIIFAVITVLLFIWDPYPKQNK
jgi:predicted MFS family arabinose efflux permease